jgi:hypothetical protein
MQLPIASYGPKLRPLASQRDQGATPYKKCEDRGLSDSGGRIFPMRHHPIC